MSPEKSIHSISTSSNVTFNPNIPVVTRISGNLLLKNGWGKNGLIYTKDKDQIIYDGVRWKLNGEVVEHIEDLNQNK